MGTAPVDVTSGADARVLDAADVAGLRDRLLAGAVPASDGARVDLLRALEELKSAVTAVQARVVVELDASVRAEEAREGVPADKRGRGVPVQVGLALRESPARARIDEEVCGDAERVSQLGTGELIGRVRRRAIELDPAAVVERARRAASERSVWIRPAPDTMTYVTALLPVAQGVGVYAALRRAADRARAEGDERSGGQVMADTLVERVTGQSTADAVPVTVNLVMSDATLLGAGHEPALVLDDAGPGGGVVPAQVARNLVAHGLEAGTAWVRRLYADPGGRLVAASAPSRFFADGLAALLRVRDQGVCRTPYCDAPIRHLDHVVPAAEGGSTDEPNGQGLCEACNQAKNTGALRQATEPDGDGHHVVLTTTATGHRYRSTAPPPPTPAPPPTRARAAPAGPRPAPEAVRPRSRDTGEADEPRDGGPASPVEGVLAAALRLAA